jgi:hypothetical protein
MKNPKPKKQKPEENIEIVLGDLIDEEFLEMIELIEKAKKGEITPEELIKLEYIQKTRENLYGGGA